MLGFSFLIPLFFVTSGMAISLERRRRSPVPAQSHRRDPPRSVAYHRRLFERFHGPSSGSVVGRDAHRPVRARPAPITVAVTGLASSTGIIPTWLASLSSPVPYRSCSSRLAFLLGRAVERG